MGGDDAEPRLGAARRRRPGLHRHDDRGDPDPVQLRPRGRLGQVPALAGGRRGATRAALQRRRLLPRRRRRPADDAHPLVAVDRLPDAGLGVAGDDRSLLPQHRLGGAAVGDDRRARGPPRQRRPRNDRRLRPRPARGRRRSQQFLLPFNQQN